jgi:hypothetical protein
MFCRASDIKSKPWWTATLRAAVITPVLTASEQRHCSGTCCRRYCALPRDLRLAFSFKGIDCAISVRVRSA